jgi:NADH dehydrogenase/NADH:ubiquinone oxidoreductase subunit G
VNVEVTLNGVKVVGHLGMTILELARENHVDIPTLCYHPDLTPIGVCRICVVEVQGSRTLLPACHTPIAPGMVIHTHSAKVLETRRILLELILASHPDVCLVCDKGNRCELRQVAGDLGISMPRFRMKRHYYPSEDAGPYVVRDLTKCILCRRCVRACHEIKKAGILAMGYQGFSSKVIAGHDEPLNEAVCQSCDVCISVCPVGALAKRRRSDRGQRSRTMAANR